MYFSISVLFGEIWAWYLKFVLITVAWLCTVDIKNQGLCFNLTLTYYIVVNDLCVSVILFLDVDTVIPQYLREKTVTLSRQKAKMNCSHGKKIYQGRLFRKWVEGKKRRRWQKQTVGIDRERGQNKSCSQKNYRGKGKVRVS